MCKSFFLSLAIEEHMFLVFIYYLFYVNWILWMLPMFLLGAQFKALVEYAPSQQVPKSNIKKDGREGTIMKGPKQSLCQTVR
jgi:hypothetical protein